MIDASWPTHREEAGAKPGKPLVDVNGFSISSTRFPVKLDLSGVILPSQFPSNGWEEFDTDCRNLASRASKAARSSWLKEPIVPSYNGDESRWRFLAGEYGEDIGRFNYKMVYVCKVLEPTKLA